MEIIHLINSAAFGPEEIKVLEAAFAGACKTLGLVEQDDPLVEVVARAIIDAAVDGPTDPMQIAHRALVALHTSEPMPARPA